MPRNEKWEVENAWTMGQGEAKRDQDIIEWKTIEPKTFKQADSKSVGSRKYISFLEANNHFIFLGNN